MAGKRRLPLIAPTPSGDGEDSVRRAPWQWVGFGAVAIFTAWIPLAGIAGALAARLAGGADAGGDHVGRTGVAIVALYACAIALGSFAGGFIVGRWGGEGVGPRQAGLAGVAAAVVAVGAAWMTSGFDAAALFVVVVSAPSAATGGWRGLRARTRLP